VRESWRVAARPIAHAAACRSGKTGLSEPHHFASKVIMLRDGVC
jgi:hypothetical protein